MFCPHCGQQVRDDINFCPACGTMLSMIETAPVSQPVVIQHPVSYDQQVISVQPAVSAYNTTPVVQTYQNALPNDYLIILLDVGNCTKTAARDIFEEVLGYTVTQARKLTDNCPIELARNLNHEQALYICQLLTEYGMSVAVGNSQGYVDMGHYATSSVFTKSGTLLQKVGKVFATLTTLNQVNTFISWNRSDPYRFVFRPHYDRVKPPVYARSTPRASVHPGLSHMLFSPFIPQKPAGRTAGPSKSSSRSKPASSKPSSRSKKSSAAKPSQKKTGGRGPGGFGGLW